MVVMDDVRNGPVGVVAAFFDWVIGFYEDPGFAYTLATFMLGAFVVIVVIALAQHFLVGIYPVARRTQELCKALASDGKSAGDRDARRASFARQWQHVCDVMRGKRHGERMSRAWEEFRETLMESDVLIRNSVRPHDFLAHAVSRPRWLELASNVSVGIGLLLTFVGLVAALTFTSKGISAAGPDAMQGELQNLLTAASAKFVTSIMGVGISIILKLLERGLSGHLRYALDRLCDELEMGMQHVSPQQELAEQQLAVMRDQLAAQKLLATDLAERMAPMLEQAMTQAMQPVQVALKGLGGDFSRSLSELRTGLEEAHSEQSRALREGVGSALTRAATAEIQALAAELKPLAGRVASVSELMVQLEKVLRQTGANAASQMEGASAGMREIMSGVNDMIEGLSAQLSGVGSALSQQASDRIGASTGQLETMLDTMQSRMQDQQALLARAVEGMTTATQDAARHLAEQSRNALDAATSEADRRLRESAAGIAGAIGEAHERTQQQLAMAAELASQRLRQSADGLAVTLDRVSGRTEAVAGSLGEVESGLRGIGVGLKDQVLVLGEASRASEAASAGMIEAHGALASTLEAFRVQSLGSVAQMITGARALGEQLAAQGEAGRAFAKHLEDASAALADAWETHEERFSDVDKVLAATIEKLPQLMQQVAGELEARVTKVDQSFAQAVMGLGEQIDNLTENLPALATSKAA
jgi:hypothetical protein